MKICVLTGAGVSAESGINTFRDAGGLWEGHNVMDVASPEGWEKNQRLVQRFYNDRRRQLKEVAPNAAHKAIALLEAHHDVTVVTQNVDDLHERAGSSNIIHLHGELRKARSTRDATLVYGWERDITEDDRCELGGVLRPHIVWFGEAVPMLEFAAQAVSMADVIIIVGTSMQVYPAASLTMYASPVARLYYIDPRPTINHELSNIGDRLEIIAGMAGEKVPPLVASFLD